MQKHVSLDREVEVRLQAQASGFEATGENTAMGLVNEQRKTTEDELTQNKPSDTMLLQHVRAEKGAMRRLSQRELAVISVNSL